MEKRLTRSRSNRMLWGVCGGLAAYFNVDTTLVRLITVLTLFLGGFGIIAYIILAIVMPLESSSTSEPKQVIRENVAEIRETAQSLGKEIQSTFSQASPADQGTGSSVKGLTVVGIVIVVIGLIFLITSLTNVWWFSWKYLWPAILIIIGLLILMARRK
jgi:phage shock protein PspC (stress-responsive transcriptional regulator)/uncharacterized integral membrane protein